MRDQTTQWRACWIHEALELLDGPSAAYASQRMGIILNAQTVYHDLVICDQDRTFGLIVDSCRA